MINEKKHFSVNAESFAEKSRADSDNLSASPADLRFVGKQLRAIKQLRPPNGGLHSAHAWGRRPWQRSKRHSSISDFGEFCCSP